MENDIRSSKQSRKKWTWVRYTVVAVIVVVLLSFTWVVENTEVIKDIRTRDFVKIEAIRTACLNYYTEYDTLPPSSENHLLIKALIGDNPRSIAFISLKKSDMNANGEIVDSWGTPFRIVFRDKGEVHVTSAGPDKIFGTPDDIINN